MQQRTATGCLMQLIGIAVGAVLLLSYSQAGKEMLAKLQIGVGAMQVGQIARMLDRHAVSNLADTNVNPYPQDYPEFARMLKAETENIEKPWKDHWGTNYYYWSYLHEGVSGYYLGSAGPDTKWRTEDDIWMHRHGDRRRTRNMGGEGEKRSGSGDKK